jgi:alpha-L-fucosidase
MKLLSTILMIFLSSQFAFAQKKAIDPLPTKQQLAWHEMEFYLFAHFGPNTFTDKEWGLGNEPEDAFNPTNLDCDQWCRIAKAAGAKGIIITAKHHDGFCLWPSKYSTHTVRESKWKNGKGDVLKELSASCKKYGLKFGVYISPWDRNHPKYGTAEYNDVFVKMMKEIFYNYGPIWELWWDGANGEGPNGKKQLYDWKRFEKTVRTISPSTVIFSDIGPDIRWVGNEKGIAGATNWNLLDTSGYKRGAGAPANDTLQQGNVNGKNWIPAECDVSIRPGWFYHANEDNAVKSPEELFQLFLKSVGRGANLLLNVPPDRRGLINQHDSSSLMKFKKLRDQSFNNNILKGLNEEIWSPRGMLKKSNLTDGRTTTYENSWIKMNSEFHETQFHLKRNKINCIILKEPIDRGQRIARGAIHLGIQDTAKDTISILRGTETIVSFETVGRKRILTFPTTDADLIVIRVFDSKRLPALAEVEAYLIDETLIEQKK